METNQNEEKAVQNEEQKSEQEVQQQAKELHGWRVIAYYATWIFVFLFFISLSVLAQEMFDCDKSISYLAAAIAWGMKGYIKGIYQSESSRMSKVVDFLMILLCGIGIFMFGYLGFFIGIIVLIGILFLVFYVGRKVKDNIRNFGDDKVD